MQRAEVKNLNGTKIAVLDDEMDVSEGDSVWVLPDE